jgi:hypothetical protein
MAASSRAILAVVRARTQGTPDTHTGADYLLDHDRIATSIRASR